MNPFKIVIPRRAYNCSRKNEPLATGSEYYSTLTEEEEGYNRKDFCASCWEAGAQHEYKTFWKSRVTALKAEITSHNRDERALDLLKQALADLDSSAAFILALYLAHRRLLYLRQQLQQDNGQVINLYEVAETEEMLCVPKLSLAKLDIASLQQQLARKLQHQGG